MIGIANYIDMQLFSKRNPHEGIKVHQDAGEARVAAASRLHELGITTLSDGGYLTPRGQEAVEMAEALVNLLQVRAH